MSAPDNAYVIGEVKGWIPLGLTVECSGCKWKGRVDELLGVDDDDTLWCPNCKGSGGIYE